MGGTTEGLKVEVRGRGGPALVFLHAFAASSAAWNAVIEELEGEHLCVAPDLRGFGRSAPADVYDIAGHAEDVLALVEARVDGPWLLAGHSMGGKIATAIASRCPEGLAGVALFAPSPPTPEPISDDERAERLAAHGDQTAARATLRDITVGPILDQAGARFVEDTLACSPSAWAWWLAAGSREDISDFVERIAAPLVVMLGACDPVIPLHALDAALLSRQPSALLTLVPETGHLLPLERPSSCADALRQLARSIS